VAIEEVIEQHKNEDPKSQLQEWAQANGYSTPKYLTRNVHGPDHAKVFEIEVRVNSKVMGEGIGKSKQAAEKSAAQKALESINQH
jgi:ribonuclease-3